MSKEQAVVVFWVGWIPKLAFGDKSEDFFNTRIFFFVGVLKCSDVGERLKPVE